MKTIYLVDASAFIHRSFHALGNFKTKNGQPTGAIYGFTNTILKLIKDYDPQFIAVVMDSKGPTIRHSLFPQYKANRPPMALDLVKQQDLIQEIIEALELTIVQKPGFEADDLIAVLSQKLTAQKFKTIIVSADKDFYQLLNENVELLDPGAKNKKIQTKADFEAKYFFEPKLFLEMQGLMGDSSDNIPGVVGVGEKTAHTLITKFATLENLYQNIAEIPQKKLKENLIRYKEQAFLSRKLALLGHDAQIEFDINNFKIKQANLKKITKLFQELEFNSLLKNLPHENNLPLLNIIAEPTISLQKISYDSYLMVDNPNAWQELEKSLKLCRQEQKPLSLDLETTSIDPMLAQVVGMSLCHEKGKSFYIPIGHMTLDAKNQSWDKLSDLIKPYLADEKIPKIAQNAKYDWSILRRLGFTINQPQGDPMLASYLLNPGSNRHNLDFLSLRYLNHQAISYESVTKIGRTKKNFSLISPQEAFHYAAEDSDLTLRLAEQLKKELEKDPELLILYEELELPLEDLLTDMELSGVLVSAPILQELSKEFSHILIDLEKNIYKSAGRDFNIASPQQLAQILFEELKLPIKKKTPKGQPSTDALVLEGLALIHPLPADIIYWRELAKLKSTYTEALPKQINPNSGRIHTSYNQTVTATGRLSSSKPNLQNIPIKGNDGARIRSAFIAAPYHTLIIADYSQIELRIMAHYSGDETLSEAFENDLDIHSQTAAEIFSLDIKEITPQLRQQAKAINFGLIYGQGAFGLANQLGIERKQAQIFIDNYFKRFAGVYNYMEESKKTALNSGEVSTWFGRKRILSVEGGYNARQSAQRMAINTPIQGTAADLIKMAMLSVDRRLKKEELKSKLIMQVHDELILEAPLNEAPIICALVKEEMEKVGFEPFLKNAQPLKVKLVANVSQGDSWSTGK